MVYAAIRLVSVFFLHVLMWETAAALWYLYTFMALWTVWGTVYYNYVVYCYDFKLYQKIISGC